MQFLKVLILTSSFPIRKDSVSGLFVGKLVENLPSNIKPTVIAPWDDEASGKFNNEYEIKCFKYAPKKLRILAHKPGGIPAALQLNRFNILLVPLFLIAMFVKCMKEAKNVDLIHANWSICGVIGGFVGYLYKKPVITTFRGEDVNKAKTNLAYKLILKHAVKNCSYATCVSKYMVESFNKAYPELKHKVKFISNGIDKNILAEYKSPNKKNTNEFVIVTVGSLTENKNTILIVRAINKLVKQNINTILHVIGDGPCRNKIEEYICRNSLEKHVFLHGPLVQKSVYKIVDASDAFVLASFREGRPNVILESMALNTLVVASDILGVKEILEDGVTGLLFETDNLDELYMCIKKAIDHKKMSTRITQSAYQYLLSRNLFWDETARQYTSLYTSAANGV